MFVFVVLSDWFFQFLVVNKIDLFDIVLRIWLSADETYAIYTDTVNSQKYQDYN